MWGLRISQTYLEQNQGPGLQHLALKTDDIFHTMRELRRRSNAGGFDFMPPASDAYYALVFLSLFFSCIWGFVPAL